MLLVVDVGNTNISLGVYDGERLVANWRMTTSANRTADETGIFLHRLLESAKINPKCLDDCILSSVVPNIMYSLMHGIRKYLGIEPIIVEPGMKTGINLRMENPKEMGADRIVNMVAAYSIYGGPVLIIDYSTATTYDVVNEKGEFITGITAPGIQICADALYQRAAQLPKIEIKRPESFIVKNTVGSLQAGVVLGKIGETVYLMKSLKKELGLPKLKVIGTGGLAKVIDENNKIFDVLDPLLSLKGLKILYAKNKKR